MPVDLLAVLGLGQLLTGYTIDVWSLGPAPTGPTLAAASVDPSVILWDLTDRARSDQRPARTC
jgi:hypothetical protein